VHRLLERNGPLWAASWAPGPHIRVITGLDSGTLYINDPAPVGAGAQYENRFNDFFGAMEDLGARERDQPWPVYLAYLRHS
jgi:hypothetical protein